MPFSLRKLSGAAARLEWLTLRWWQRAIMWLFWPLMFAGTLYVGLFFFLNSTPFARMLEAQLDAAMQGDWTLGDVSIDMTLTTLRVDAVALDTPEGQRVVTAERLTAPLPWGSLWSLLDSNHIDLHDIELDHADVLLDFTADGPFNLLRALAPAQPGEGGSDFSIALHDVDLGASHALLRFDGFEVEVDEVEVDDYTLRVGEVLQMQTAPHPAGLAAVRVGRGTVRFEPRMFNFPLGQFGSPERGLAGDSGAGRLGHVAGMTRLATTALHNSCARLAADHPGVLCGELGERPVRGNLEVHFANTTVRDFWWRESTFGMRAVHAELLEPGADGELAKVGAIRLHQPWMNVSPTAGEIAEASERYGHALPETRPQDTILYYASADLKLPANSQALAWFIGPLIDNDDPLDVVAQVSGDLGNAEGLFSARIDRLEAAGARIDDLSLSATLEGQRVDLVDLTASALSGRLEATGHYLILDGDFDLDLELGRIDAETIGRVDGIDAGEVASGELQRFLGGELLGALNVAQTAGKLAVTLREPLRLELATPLPYSGATHVVLEQASAGQSDSPSLLTIENRVLRTSDEIRLQVGADRLVIEPDLTLWLDSLEVGSLGLRLDIGDVGQYLDKIGGLDGLDARTKSLSVTAHASGPLLAPKLSTTVALRGGRAFGVEIPRLDLTARYERGRVDVKRLTAQTSLGSLEASGWLQPFRRTLTELRDDIPMKLHVETRDVRLENLPGVASYGLRGLVELASVDIDGSTRAPQVRGRVSARDLEARGHQVPRLETRFGYDGHAIELDALRTEYRSGDDEDAMRASLTLRHGRYGLGTERVAIDGLDATYGPLDREGDAGATRLSVEHAHYGLRDGSFGFEAFDLRALRLHELPPLRDAVPGLQARVDFKGSGSGDLDTLLGRNSRIPLVLDARLDVRDIVWGERKVGELRGLSVTTPEPTRVALHGELAVHGAETPLQIEGHAELDTMRARARLSFDSLSLLDLVPELATALNGDPTVHRSRFRSKPPLVEALNISGAVEAAWSRPDGLVVDVALSKLATIVREQSIVSRGPVQLHYAHEAGRLEVRRMELANHDKSLMLHGSAALDGTVDLELTGELNAALARMAGDTVAEARGSLALAVQAVGDVLDDEGAVSLSELDLTGFVAVREPLLLRIRGLGEPLEVKQGLIQIARGRDCPSSSAACYFIPPDKAFAGSVLGGTFELSGEVGRRDVFLPESAELLVSAKDLAFRIKNTLTVTFDVPELRLFVFDLADIENDPPRLYGAVEITEGRYYKDHLVQSEIFAQSLDSLSKSDRREERFEVPIWQRMPELAAVELDITIDSESGFRIDNEVAGARVDLELEVSNLHLGGTLSELEPSGVVNIRDGDVVFRQNRFEVLPGAQLRFNQSLDAVVDVAAQAEINTRSSFASSITGGTTRDRRNISTSDLARGSELYIVTLSLTGALSALTWTLESNPLLDANNIIYLVLTGQTIESATANADSGGAGGSVAFSLLLAPFVESQVDDILSADQFKFQFAEGAAQFSYIQQVNRALRVAAGVSIRGSEGNESALAGEYRFDDRLLLELIAQDAVEEEGKAPQFSLGGRLEWRILLD